MVLAQLVLMLDLWSSFRVSDKVLFMSPNEVGLSFLFSGLFAPELVTGHSLDPQCPDGLDYMRNGINEM